MSRPSKDQYYLNIAKQINERSNCLRSQNGAIIVRDDQIVATGYNGAPRKTKSCMEKNECLRDKLNIPHGKQYEMCSSVHAEQNAIINAARAGVSLLDGDMYIYCGGKDGSGVDSFPCFICKKMILNAGLKRVICSTKDGGYKVFQVSQWVEDWQKRDILDDESQYGKDQNEA